MDRQTILNYALNTYGSQPEYLWQSTPDACILRHSTNRKWYAVLMSISKSRLGIASEDRTDIINVKCPPEIVPSMHRTKGIYPAYHMNKKHWVSVMLEEADAELMHNLLEMSFGMTDTKKRPQKS